MAQSEKQDVSSEELVDDLMSFLEVFKPCSLNPVDVRKELKKELEELKMFFLSYTYKTEYDKPIGFEKKVSFLENFSTYVFYYEIGDKPEGMSDKEFIFDVKFEEYSNAVVEKVMSRWHEWR